MPAIVAIHQAVIRKAIAGDWRATRFCLELHARYSAYREKTLVDLLGSAQQLRGDYREAGQEMPARDFIPTAEKYGLIVAIDRWVIAKALAVLAKRTGASDKSSLFVRLSEQSIREGDSLYRWLAEQVKQRPLKKDELVFSIQESIVESHIAKAKALGQALRGLGADIALDYFGAGAGSIRMLEHLTPSFVRFDYSFIKDFNDPKLQKKFGELMEAAKQRQIKTIVGQIEDANAMARLWQLGVNYIQGFFVQQPEAVLLASDVR